jgi:phytoene synthase
MSLPVEESLAYCRSVTRARARNFYYSFVLLPRQEHDAMCALYAFMRYCDDLSDEAPAGGSPPAAALLNRWRADLEAALAGVCTDHPVWPAFCATVKRYGIPHEYFRDMIDGVSSDLEPREFTTFKDLYGYCYRVASVVGLSVIRIMGARGLEAMDLAEKCGVAFQLTNILRDVREDAERGRVYFPAEDMARFGVSREEVLGSGHGKAIRDLMRFEAARARAYYRDSAPLIGMVDRRSRSSLWALIEIYRRLLEKIETSGFEVFNGRIRLSAAEKCRVVARAALRLH